MYCFVGNKESYFENVVFEREHNRQNQKFCLVSIRYEFSAPPSKLKLLEVGGLFIKHKIK